MQSTVAVGSWVRRGRDAGSGEAFDENIHDATADLVFAVGGLGEVDRDDAGAAIVEDFHGLLPHFRLAASPADGAKERAVGADDHLGAGLARGGAAGAGDGGEDHGLASFYGIKDFAVDLILHTAIVAPWRRADKPMELAGGAQSVAGSGPGWPAAERRTRG